MWTSDEGRLLSRRIWCIALFPGVNIASHFFCQAGSEIVSNFKFHFSEYLYLWYSHVYRYLQCTLLCLLFTYSFYWLFFFLKLIYRDFSEVLPKIQARDLFHFPPIFCLRIFLYSMLENWWIIFVYNMCIVLYTIFTHTVFSNFNVYF